VSLQQETLPSGQIGRRTESIPTINKGRGLPKNKDGRGNLEMQVSNLTTKGGADYAEK